MADQVDAYEGNLGHAVVLPESSGDMDESIATLVHLQQLQQKQEVIQLMESHTVTNADAGFRRGLEELVRDHLNTCMALASCSATVHDPGISSSSSSNMMSRPSSYNAMHDESDDTHHSLHENNHNLAPYDAAQSHESDVPLFQMSDSAYCNAHHHILDHGQSDYEHENTDQLVQEQREADSRLVDDHSSVQERPRSRILTSWAAQRAQEMITTMERQAREAELLALAGLHAVSTLDASFLRESLTRADPSLGGEARQHRRPSSIVQMWRELEEERRTERARFDPEERMATPSEPSNPSENVENFESHLNARRADGGVEQNVLAEVRTAQTQVNEDTEDLLQSQNSDFTEWELNETERIDMHEQIEVSERHSAQTQEGEREHVRQIVQRLMTDNGMQTMSTGGQTQNRSAWLDENERERVRELAREWVRVTNEQRAGMRERGGRQRPQTANGLGHARETGLAPEDEILNENPVRGLSRSERRFLDRQVILDMLMRVERERQRELQLLVEHRAVSDFAHRHRLQSFLRGRFLRTGAVSEEERIPSSAAGELGQLRQRRAVSDLREGFRFRLETILGSQANNRLDLERANAHGTAQRRRRRETQPVVRPLVEGTPIRRGVPSEGASRGRQGITTARRVTDFQSAEESTEYNMELQELLGRRSVTNVLASEFRDRLDRLIRSFLQTQGHSPVAWDLTRTARTGASQQQQQQQQRQRARQPTQWQRQVQNQQQTVIPPPPPPPPQPAWQQELQQGTWPRPPPSLHRHSYLEVEGINDLRTDVSKLQQGMSDLQRMMETCIEMQLDLQRSVRQELAGALQQMYDGKAVPEEAIDGSKWVSVKRGICCVCCDRNIDSLLYRCGHMCTCLKCASELIRNSGKCPMCRAPIKEVVRAFTVA